MIGVPDILFLVVIKSDQHSGVRWGSGGDNTGGI
jgi:hypothetical protein